MMTLSLLSHRERDIVIYNFVDAHRFLKNPSTPSGGVIAAPHGDRILCMRRDFRQVKRG